MEAIITRSRAAGIILAIATFASLVACTSATEPSTGTGEADLSTCSEYTTCDACTSGINCFWSAGCCVPLSVNDRYEPGTASPGRDYAGYRHECADYERNNGSQSVVASASCHAPSRPGSSPASPGSPSTPPAEQPWVCPGTTSTVATNTILQRLTTGDGSYGCFSLDVLIAAKRIWGPSYYDAADPVRFDLCTTAHCEPTDTTHGETLRWGGTFMQVNVGYHDQQPATSLFLAASSQSGKPENICYRNVKRCD